MENSIHHSELLCNCFKKLIKKPCALENQCSALWMIPSLPKQSLRHGLCIRLKMPISTSPTSRENR
ncbi:MAG: hypothetical protein MR436_02685, partial [Eubacterium sp.]|nr:hypothetical protein [Eubacterium sp.]